MNRCTLWFDDPETTNSFTEDRNRHQLFLFGIHTLFNIPYIGLQTYNTFWNDDEMKKDETSQDWFAYIICELMTILYALASFRFKVLKQYLMIVFFFFKCVIYTCNSNFERADWDGISKNFFDLFIFYFCVCQLISSSNWVLETVACNFFYLLALIGMTYHMKNPVSEKEEETFIPQNQVTYQILVAQIIFIAFTVVNRFVIERRERIMYLAKITVQQQHL